ncbi:NADP-dependent oxidoreductase domain-containing protein 1 [Hyperolius riggenbachi]|uniref:NADP-dependent oxidoreductase domain-containing protein 1 n=1 Tax=Hyperolius riggenbachi TaxID=752182 RepID=UPI0035A2E055
MPGICDLTAGLCSLQAEHGMNLEHLSTRRSSLMLHASAHAVFFCKLLLRTWQQLQSVPLLTSHPPRTSPSRGPRVGIIGGGHLGKQLVHCLISLGEVPADLISVSTRRPETLRDIQALGVCCFYDNMKLVRGAELVFLCCLPSQLPAVCAEICGHLPQWCVVYSMVCAVPLIRVKRLLGHSGVVRPQYKSDNSEGLQCHPHVTVTEALRDGCLIRNTIPVPGEASGGGGVRIVSHFIEPALYAILNVCTSHGLSHDQSLSVLNGLIQQQMTSEDTPPSFTRSCMVSREFESSLASDSPFPLFDLSCVQMKETPLSQHLAASPQLRSQLSRMYCALLHHPDTHRA